MRRHAAAHRHASPTPPPSGQQAGPATPARHVSLLRPTDVLAVALFGLRSRPMRAVLSALGIAIGIAAMVAVVGVSSSSQARLQADLDRLGTNLLSITAGQDFTGEQARLPTDTVGKVDLLDGVLEASGTAVLDLPVYRSPLSDPAATGGITTTVADQDLLDVVSGHVAAGAWFTPATAGYPTVVLGDTAARRLGVVTPDTQVLLGGQYFTVVGILEPAPLAPELDVAALINPTVAATLFAFDGSPTTVYERSTDEAVGDIRALLPLTVNPQQPDQVDVSRPSDALAARSAADAAFTGLLLGVGSIALLVGGIGVANTMIISVLERRREIGLRRALGATRRHVATQFLGEALLLSALGGLAGSLMGGVATVAVATVNEWPPTLPVTVVAVAVLATMVVGAVAGLHPALRAARTPPTAALSA